MKTSLLLCSLFAFFSLPMVLSAETTLSVNTPLSETVKADETIAISGTPTVGSGAVVVLNAAITFTIPDEEPSYDDVASDKLALAVSTEGEILIADGSAKAWKKSGVTITEETPIAVKAEGYLEGATLKFNVSLGEAEAITVTAPSSDATLNEIALTGEGSVSTLSLALVSTSIIPGSDETIQDSALVSQYVTWLNDAEKGQQMSDSDSDTAMANAFIMNAYGTPLLAITAIDWKEHTLTLSATVKDEGTSIDLSNINGTLYLVWAKNYSDEPTVETISLSDTTHVTADSEAGTLAITFNKDAAFIKAHAGLSEPEATFQSTNTL